MTKKTADVLATLNAIGCGWAEDAIEIIEAQAAHIAELTTYSSNQTRRITHLEQALRRVNSLQERIASMAFPTEE